VLFIHVPCLWMFVLFYFSFVCLYVYDYAFKSKVRCGSALGPGTSRLPYYCTILVCVPDVIAGLAVWRHNNKTKKLCTCVVKQKSGSRVSFLFYCESHSELVHDLLLRQWPRLRVFTRRCIDRRASQITIWTGRALLGGQRAVWCITYPGER